MTPLTARTLNATSATTTEQPLALPTGVTLRCLAHGEPSGTPVVLLHGLADSARAFLPLIAHLPPSLRAIALTQRGHGDADRPLTGYRTPQLAADVVAALDALGIARAVVVGHSLGAHVAQWLAAHHPDRVLGAVLVGAFPTLLGHPAAAAIDDVVGALVDPIDESVVTDFQTSTLARPVAGSFLASVIAESRKVPARVWQEAWAGMRDTDLSRALRRITAPVLLLWGDEDALVDASMRAALLQALPTARAHMLAGAGHAPHWEDPERTAGEITAFVEALDAPTASDPALAPRPTSPADGTPPPTTPLAAGRSMDERIPAASVGTLELFGLYVGTRLSLYATLSARGPLTPPQLAAAAGIDARYAREWCEQQAVAGFLAVDEQDAAADARRYRLPAEHTGALVRPDDPAHVAPLADMVVGIAAVLDEVVDAYRTGAGVPYARYGAAFRRGQGGINRPAFGGDLSSWIDAAGLGRRLARPGARVVDVGCGHGWSTLALAAAFPHAEVVGLDADAASIAEARQHARQRGAAVRFVVADATAVAAEGPFDAVLVLETLHDLARPVDALRACRAALADGGAVLVADERVAERFTAPGDELERMMYGWSISHCLPAARAEEGSAALGTVLRPDAVRELAADAGFASAVPLDVDAGFFRLYLLSP